MEIAHKSGATIRNYLMGIRKLTCFHNQLPGDLEIDQVIDFLVYMQTEQQLNWRTIKIYVAGLRHYYSEMEQDAKLAQQIPYPKEEKSLPKLLSREELKQLFESCINTKHRVMFRLMYGSGLRRNELLKLKITDIDTHDGKLRIRINQGKGNKDRYTVLSYKVLEELREYYKMCLPKVYLFNGRLKGEKMSAGGLRHALMQATKRSGIKKEVNMHILRHCFASHALEDGMNIRTLQYLLGHSSINTTMIYLHVSEIPLVKAFSPLDNWAE